jgi:hypothetical protein
MKQLWDQFRTNEENSYHIFFIIAMLLTTGTAHADDWHLHRTCIVIKIFDDSIVYLELKDIQELQKYIPDLKKCTAFWQCVADREAGKVKHCYENDRRWKLMIQY